MMDDAEENKGAIRWCPNCGGKLDGRGLAQGVHECGVCGGIFFILVTTKPVGWPVTRGKAKRTVQSNEDN